MEGREEERHVMYTSVFIYIGGVDGQEPVDYLLSERDTASSDPFGVTGL